MRSINEFSLEMKYCPGCKEEKVKCANFSPKGEYCRECKTKQYKKGFKARTSDPKNIWGKYFL